MPILEFGLLKGSFSFGKYLLSVPRGGNKGQKQFEERNCPWRVHRPQTVKLMIPPFLSLLLAC
jgi:hypothetical protein